MLHFAAFSDDLDIIEFIVSQRPALLNVKTADGLTALDIASLEGKTQVVNYLKSLRSTTPEYDSATTPTIPSNRSAQLLSLTNVLESAGLPQVVEPSSDGNEAAPDR